MRRVIAWTALIFLGVFIMSCKADEEGIMKLNWEWAGDRSPDSTVGVEVTGIMAVKKGFFGIGQSPSIVDNLPDPVEMTGRVVGQQNAGKPVTLIAPAAELPDGLKAGEVVELALVQESVCIGVTRK